MSNTKQLKAGVLLSYLTLALSNIIALVYTPFMLRLMGQSEYGLYSLVASVVAYLTILDFGFGNAIVRYTAKYRAESREKEQSSLFGMFFILYVCIGIVAFIAGIGLYLNVDILFEQSMTSEELEKSRIMMLLMVLNVVFTFPLSIFPSIIMAYEKFIFHKLVNLVRILLQPCIMIPLLLMGYKAVGMVVLTTILNLGTLLVYCWYCFGKLNIKIAFNGFDRFLLREVSLYSFYVFLSILVDRAFWSTGQFILGMLNGTKDVAVYSLVVQLCNYYMAFSLAISGVFLPKMTQLVSERRSMVEISDLFIKIGRIQYIVMAYILFGFILFGKVFVAYWAGNGYEKVYPLAVLIMIPQTIPLIQNLGISILQAQNRQGFRSLLNVIIALVSVWFGYELTKKYGIWGCAISTACALFIGHGLILNWYYKSRIHIDIVRFWKSIIQLTLPVLFSYMVMVILLSYQTEGNFLIQSLYVLLYTCVFLISLWAKGCNLYEKSLLYSLLGRFRNYLNKCFL